MLVSGAVLMAVAVWWVHYSGFPKTVVVEGVETPLIVDYFNWVPRGWLPKTAGYVVALAASQLLLAGAAIRYVLGEKMTWSRAGFAAWLAWFELVIVFGIVPSEWLNLSQTDLDWSKARVLVSIPAWLVLGNQVDFSLAALKDAISGTYHIVMLAAFGIFVLKLQQIGKARPPAAPPKVKLSPYGRPLLKGDE
jgi:hypothetical protein